MSFERGQRIVEAIELLEPYMSLPELMALRDRSAVRAINEESDMAFRVISQVTDLMVKKRVDNLKEM